MTAVREDSVLLNFVEVRMMKFDDHNPICSGTQKKKTKEKNRLTFIDNKQRPRTLMK